QQALLTGAGQSRRVSNTVKESFLYVGFPLKTKDLNGVVRLAVSLSQLEDSLSDLKKYLLSAFLIGMMISTLLGFGWSTYLAKPINEMTSIAKEISNGDFSRKVNIKTGDELEELAEAINEMLVQIQLKINEVVDNKSELEAVLSSILEGLMVIDQSGRILIVNDALKQYLQIKKNAVGHKPIETIRNIEIQEIVDQIIKKKKTNVTREINVLYPQEKTLLIHATPINRRGAIDGAVMVFHDITELRRLEKVRKDFVTNVSHELRTPITSIKGYAETLLEGAIHDKKNAVGFLEIICSESDRLATLVEDILDLSKIESGKYQLVLQDCEVHAVLDRVLSGINRQLEQKNISFKKEIDSRVGSIKADESSLAQIFLNLIDNAVKYNKPDGTIIFRAKDDIQEIVFEVEDSGLGIPLEDQERIFERFYRVDKAHSRSIGGTGLGLSIVKHIVQLYGGRITLKSEFN
ncbi:MAG: HAMP domain-containing protein, partial [Candidatus Omnitrophica bacterium]|nr:HAMP domain-containing protein [Candidatus Omnitrophota bacterium]